MPRNDARLPELYVTVSGPDPESHSRHLWNWLAAEDALRGRLELRSRQAAPSGGADGWCAGRARRRIGLRRRRRGAGPVPDHLADRAARGCRGAPTKEGLRVRVDVHVAKDPQAVVIREVGELLKRAGE